MLAPERGNHVGLPLQVAPRESGEGTELTEPQGWRKIRRALISVWDKTGLDDFVRALHGFGVELISTGNTQKAIEAAGVPVRAVSEATGSPEMLDGRVKTLHPKIHGGLLAVRDNPDHMRQVEEHGIPLIDLVVSNLYPFERTVADPNVELATAVEMIDIGGPCMVRAAAKNSRDVAIVTEAEQYAAVLQEMREHEGSVSLELRQRLALAAFRHTAHYDAAIVNFLTGRETSEEDPLPAVFAPSFEKISGLRYGENPHQKAAFYGHVGAAEPGLPGAQQLHGKELSFNNLLDLSNALNSARLFEEPTAIIIKHLNPCGAASAATLAEAFELALLSDPQSAFGSVIGFNRVVDAETASRMGSEEYLREVIEPRYRAESGDEDSILLPAFAECVIAPGYTDEALEVLKRLKGLRVMLLADFDPPARREALELRQVPGGLLLQQQDLEFTPPSEWRIVTDKRPTPEQMKALEFADKIAKCIKSNVIVLCQGTATVGVGAGQMSRIDSARIAARRAGQRAAGSVLASDAMFPARDGLDEAAKTGAVAMIQPGGSIRDDEVIAAANEHGIAMVMTGRRHFWH